MRDELDIPLPAGGPSYRVSRRPQAMDPSTRRLALIAGGVGGALLLVLGCGYALSGHRGGGVPYVAAAPGPVRVKPDKPGGLEVLNDDEQTAGADAKEVLVPGAESPDPKALRAQEKAVPALVQAETPQAGQQVALSATAPAPSAAPPLPLAANPDFRPSPGRAAPPAPATPVVPAAARPATGVTAAPVGAAPPPATGSMQVQLAALASEEAAMSEWTRLSRRMPDLFGGRHPAVTRTERDGKTYFRLRTGGFSDTAQAATFCQRVREKGGGCSIASF